MTRIEYLVNHPYEVEKSDIPLLKKEIEKYPYFYTLRALLLYGFKKENHPSFEDYLNKTSIYSSKRNDLYHYINTKQNNNNNTTTINNNKEQEEDDKGKVLEIKEPQPEDTETKIHHDINDPKITFSFGDWLKKIPNQTIDKNLIEQKEEIKEREIKYKLIDNFLEKNPKITPNKKTENVTSQGKSNIIENSQEYSDLMTETLAQIYIEQKKFDKAIKSYKILILKYPEKNSFFANRIKEIENLKNNK